jgi:hypothetical protein
VLVRDIIQVIMQKLGTIFGCSLVVWFSGGLTDCFAEALCRAEVSYSWSRTQGPNGPEGSVEARKGAENAEASSGTQAPLITVHFTSIERRGRDEKTARLLLDGDIQRQKARASDHCKRAHEAFGECVATKLSVKGTLLNSLSFSARAQVESALVDECRVQQGVCGSVSSSEIVCRDVEEPSEQAAESKGEGATSEDSSEKRKKEGASNKKK